MSIDLDKAVNEFIKYTSNYDLNNENIKRKVGHSIRVMHLSGTIASMMDLNENDTQLASLIGLLHDLGRFDQQTKYKTFLDFKSFDHGDYGVEILNKDIRKYIESPEYDDIIKIAVKNHNKYAIEDGLTDRELFFAKLIRDTDKLDILYESTCLFWENNEEEICKSDIVPEVLECFYNKSLVKNDAPGAKEGINSVISELTLVFDLNFNESFKLLKEKDYINKTLDRFDYKDKNQIEKIRAFINDYINKKVLM